MAVRFTRVLGEGDYGIDVEGVSRAFVHEGLLPMSIREFNDASVFFRRNFGARRGDAVEKLTNGRTRKYDAQAHAVLVHRLAFDAKAAALMASWKPAKSKEELVFEKLLASCRDMSDRTPGYLWGGQHGIPIDEIDAARASDCSSSCSRVLYDGGMLHAQTALVSGEFEDWGSPGRGTYFTVYANAEHVWIRLHKSRWWRFDTSPHETTNEGGDPRRGPHLRYLPRFTSSFVARHYPGM